MIDVTAPLWVGLIFGVLFGAIGELWGIGNPETLIRLARWKDRLLFGCIAIASAVGAVVLYGLYACGFSMHFSPKPAYVVGVTLGGLLFGAGMAVSGYVPGSELMALGEGRRDALYALPGALLGAVAWTMLYQTAVGRWLVHTANLGNLIASGPIDRIHPGFTFVIAVGYAIALLALVMFLPRYAGGRSFVVRAVRGGSDALDREFVADTAAYLAEGSLYEGRSRWLSRVIKDDVPNSNFFSPVKLGMSAVVGVAAVLAIFFRQIFGESTTYSWIVGNLLLPDFEYSKIMAKRAGWEPLSDMGTFVGALLTALFISRHFQGFRPVIPPSWRNRFGSSRGKRAIASFGGSCVMMFGARMADGCTSGHILSGGVQMAASAWLFTLAVSTSMIVTARVVYGDSSEKCKPDDRA
ncbi:YeeE/YedE thiosulfate transporter family protein [Mycobacterium europaeum]|uniref:YeeE/YedE thiosulfate transporter family protein n=1 Tax=Mycobacterium europaeum TaxID=761804 RepID=UPI002ADF4D5D|nr:YeeE/YedE thiosulfate transporter family protein [Mycobacterium europaeum]MEA1161831.1 YeeE/YedE thiosulfate transporter family protein [Mycobacterium europaeum]